MATIESTSQVIWLQRILEEMGEQQKGPIVIYCDNKLVIAMTKNPIYHQQTKYIAIIYHFINEVEATKEIQLKYYSIIDQVTNKFTKALARAKFEHFWTMLGKGMRQLVAQGSRRVELSNGSILEIVEVKDRVKEIEVEK
ncbi:hypothetical protein CR513_25046, partial [Mucuna pruriens]